MRGLQLSGSINGKGYQLSLGIDPLFTLPSQGKLSGIRISSIRALLQLQPVLRGLLVLDGLHWDGLIPGDQRIVRMTFLIYYSPG